MIHVRMRKKNKIDPWQLPNCQSWSDVAFGTRRAESHMNAHPLPKSWIGQNVDSKKIDQNRRMPQPTNGHLVIRPPFRRWQDWRRQYGAA